MTTTDSAALPADSAARAEILRAALAALAPSLAALVDVFTDESAAICGLNDSRFGGVLDFVAKVAAMPEGPARAAGRSQIKGLISVGPDILDSLVHFAPRPATRSAKIDGPVQINRADHVFNVIGARLWSALISADLGGADFTAEINAAPAGAILIGDPIPAETLAGIASADPAMRMAALSTLTAARVKIPDCGIAYLPVGAGGAPVGVNATNKDGIARPVQGGVAFVFEAHRSSGRKADKLTADTGAAPTTGSPAQIEAAAPAAPAAPAAE